MWYPVLPDPAHRQPIHDLVVVLPGILGSTLARDGALVWAPSAGAVWRAIASFGASLKGLTLPPDLGDGHPGDGVEPLALMPDLHLLPGVWTFHFGYGRLLAWLTSRFTLELPDPADPSRPANLLPFAYDWRLSNRFNARRLKAAVEPALERWRASGGPRQEARLILIGHSMGGRIVASETIEGVDEGGDGTVPRLSAAPKALRPDESRLRYAPPDQHGGLHSHPAVLDELEGVLTARKVVRRGGCPRGARLDPSPGVPIFRARWSSCQGQ